MSTRATDRSELVTGVSGVLTAGGMVTMVLFPLALPIIGLTLIAALPLVLIGLAAALAVGVVTVPVLLVLSLGRRGIRAVRHTPRAHPPPMVRSPAGRG